MKKQKKKKESVSNFMSLSLIFVYIILVIRLSTLLYLNHFHHMIYHTDLIVTFIIYFMMRLIILVADRLIKQKERKQVIDHLFEDIDDL